VRLTVRKICVYGLGIALFTALTLCMQVPVFENYYLCLGYVVMAVYCFTCGPFAGICVGALGVVLYCVLTSGLRGMPGWALGNVVIGLVLGISFRRTKNWKNSVLRWAVNGAAVILSTAAGILLLKSAVEQVLYGQPILFRMAKNMYAFVADVVLLLVSLPVCGQLDVHLQKYLKG